MRSSRTRSMSLPGRETDLSRMAAASQIRSAKRCSRTDGRRARSGSRCSIRRTTTFRTFRASMPGRSRWSGRSASTIDSSADLVQQFEAVWTPEQLAMHTEAAVKMQKIILETFAEIKRRINENVPTTENDVQQFMMKRYGEEGMNPSPMIVAVNANAASPHYFPRAGKGAPIKRGDLVLIDTVTKVEQTACSGGRSDVGRLCRRDSAGRIRQNLEHRFRCPAICIESRP